MLGGRRLVVCAVSALVLGCGNGSTGPGGQEGPAGDAGAPGATGSPGPTGPAGATGAAGDAGANGAIGATGAAGDSGAGSVLIQGTIQGTVVAVENNLPLQGVTVGLSLGSGATEDAGVPTTTTTTADGTFSFPNLPIGAYTLSFSRTGFIAKTASVGNVVGAPTILAVTMAANTAAGVDAPTFQLTVTSSNSADGTPTDPYAVGFGTTVTLNVTALQDTNEPTLDAAGFTYAWSVKTAPTANNMTGSCAPAGCSFTSTSSSSASFNTMSLAQTMGYEIEQAEAYANPADGGLLGYYGRLGVLGINPDETGRYTATLTVTDEEGHNYSFSQGLQSTWQTPSIGDVPIGQPVYLQGDTFQAPNWLQTSKTRYKWLNTSWNWTIASCTDGNGNAIAACGTPGTAGFISDATTQFPHFIPPVAGKYVLQVTQSSTYATGAGTTGPGTDGGPNGGYGTTVNTVTVYADQWTGEMVNIDARSQSQCTVGCHTASGLAPDKFTPWLNTAHASALERKLDGYATSHFSESCMECHTTGWSEVASAQSALNGGFYYEMNTETGPDGGTWQFPSPLVPGDYTAMGTNYPSLGALGGIQCENCHGPAGMSNTVVSNHPGELLNGGLAYTPTTPIYSARVDWSEQLCASCHEENTTHFLPGLWSTSEHANQQTAINEAAVESKATYPGGGADPQNGAQFCGRCHSAQGFARYAQQLQNGAFDRYDFLTQNNEKLDGGNAPTTAWLSSIGLNYAQVQPQTCQSCHDPHSNGAYSKDGGVGPVTCGQGAAGQANVGEANSNPTCMQLRIYDSLPGLPNGMGENGTGGISGVGEGALCMACHNGRNGEHTDTFNSSPYAELPHDSEATEALYGFNTFFVPRFNPSPHLAIQDTCSGCHVKIPTAAEVDAGYNSNHAFATDLSICQNCHGSDGVNGAAIQSEVANELATMFSTIQTTVQTAISTAAPNGLCVEVTSISNTSCTGGSCASAQVPGAVPFPVFPSSVWIPASSFGSVSLTSAGHSTTAVTIALSAPLPTTIPFYDPATLQLVGSLTTTSKTTLNVPIYTILPGSGTVTQTLCASTGAGTGIVGTPTSQLFPASGVPAKALWNYFTLSNEGSGGIHNFPWTSQVISATMTQLGAWTP